MTPSLNTFLEEKKKEFMDRYEGANTVQSSISTWMAEDIWSFISASISEAWENNNLKKKCSKE